MNELLRILIAALFAGLVFAFVRGFVQALLDDWRAWRNRDREVIVNHPDLAKDDKFMLELDAAVRRSFNRTEQQ